MVGYGLSLRRARRQGWYDAYLDYDGLKRILHEIESLYDEEDSIESDFAFRKAPSCDAATEEAALLAQAEGGTTMEEGRGRERSSSDPTHAAAFARETHDRPEDRLAEANRRARSLADDFLTRLWREVEKIFLFALARQGELADAVGSLRFASVPLRVSVSSGSLLGQLDEDGDGGSSDGEDEGGWGKGDIALNETATLLPRSSIRMPSQASPPAAGNGSTIQTHHPMFQGDGVMTASLIASPTDRSSSSMDALDSYSALGVELLHLIRYVCVNAMGVRKILKKHDKLLAQKMLGGYYQAEEDSQLGKKGHRRDRSRLPQPIITSHRLVGAADVQLQQLANSGNITAITESLHAALYNMPGSTSGADDPSFTRLECVISSIHVLRECAEIVNEPFEAFLSRKAMIVTGHDLGGLGGSTSKALDVLLCFKPESIMLMDALALAEWRQVATTRMLSYPGGFGGEMRPRLISYASESREEEKAHLEHHALGGISTSAMLVNLISTLFYTVNYYIIAPTANHYAILLGTDGAYGATLVGASSFTAMFAAFLYSWWQKQHSFRSALLCSSLCPCLGNLLYSYAISCKSSNMAVAMAGRLLVGFGSAEVVNRQVISVCVSFQSMTQASALFVAAGAIGMSIGPLLAAILDMVSGRDTNVDLQLPLLGGIVFNNITNPGFLMAALWAAEIIAITLFFDEPDRINGSSGGDQVRGGDGYAIEMKATNAECNATVYGTAEKPARREDETSGQQRNKIVSVVLAAWTELTTVCSLIIKNPALPITLLLFAYIELVDEVLISSCSMVCRRYFDWHGSTAGFLIASLGALVLPAHFVVERASRSYDERAIMMYSIVFICASLCAILNYQGMFMDTIGLGEEAWEDLTNSTTTKDASVPVSRMLKEHEALPYDWGAGVYVYLTFLAATFMGTIILEGVDTSLMSKVTPAKLNDTFINCGLLATLVGTLGRVLGDGMITISALIDKNLFTDFLNDTFFPMIPLALIGYWAVRKHYKKLL